MLGGLGFLINGDIAFSTCSRGGPPLRVNPASKAFCSNSMWPLEMRSRQRYCWFHMTGTYELSLSL